jgi:hypothetical protein
MSRDDAVYIYHCRRGGKLVYFVVHVNVSGVDNITTFRELIEYFKMYHLTVNSNAMSGLDLYSSRPKASLIALDLFKDIANSPDYPSNFGPEYGVNEIEDFKNDDVNDLMDLTEGGSFSFYINNDRVVDDSEFVE